MGRARRTPGNDNTAWDALLSISSTSGDLLGTRTLPFNDSSILLAVDALPSGGWLLGGSDGWLQNPDGLSVLSYGAKLLVSVPSVDGAPERYALEPGPRHNQISTLLAEPHRLWFGGHEDGPIMHSGDGDTSQIHATGILGVVRN